MDALIALATALIDNLQAHEGAEGFSESTYSLLEKWEKALETYHENKEKHNA